MPQEVAHHFIRAKELKEQLANIPDDAEIRFLADGTPLDFLRVSPGERTRNTEIMVVYFRACQHYYHPIVRPPGGAV